MQIDNTFTVQAPIDRVWSTLMDFERVTGCVPGAQVLNRLSEDAYQVGMSVTLGPMSLQYRGQLEVLERDPGAHRAVLRGTAKEARGQGTAQAVVHLDLSEAPGATRGTVSADMTLSGRAAAMGQGVIGSVSDQMMAAFTQNLQAMLAADGASPGAPAPGGADAAPEPGPSPVPAGPPAAPAAPAAPPASLDGLALARGVVGAQLRDPRVLAVVAGLAVVVAHRAGQRRARRQLTAWARLCADLAAAGPGAGRAGPGGSGAGGSVGPAGPWGARGPREARR